MRKLLILDKDGTLTYPINGGDFVTRPKAQAMYKWVLDRLDQYRCAGWDLAIATNQGGVASGYKTLKDAIDEVIYTMELTGIPMAMLAPWHEKHLGEAIVLEGVLPPYITIYSDALRFRKPNAGMITYLRQGYNRVLFVGDRDEDEQAAKAANVPFQWADEWRCMLPMDL
jgi:D-glycero-D-manno-heptose 1,7-bisphosphate phosphatase